jgi:hypothetical protein
MMTHDSPATAPLTEMNPILFELWRFVRGDFSPASFASWAREVGGLSEFIGAELFSEVMRMSTLNEDALWSLRCRLGDFVRAQPGPACKCIRFRDLDRFDMGGFFNPPPSFEQERDWFCRDIRNTWDERKRADTSRWWLSYQNCRVCGQDWLMGGEEMHNDVNVIERLAPAEALAIMDQDSWPPSKLNTYEFLISFGGEGVSVTFVDPADSTLVHTATQLAKERPGISLSELVRMLNISPTLAQEVAQEAMKTEGVLIDLSES